MLFVNSYLGLKMFQFAGCEFKILKYRQDTELIPHSAFQIPQSGVFQWQM